ncbi:MAG: hypothetical protein AMXMBFR7_24330 [Planctomycetota bacterium]
MLERIPEFVREIDQACITKLAGVEHGLVNVKLEFRAQALKETGKKLTEEQLIAWLLRRKLAEAGFPVEGEVAYPGGRRAKCDIVVSMGSSGRHWVELKLAWKAWFNCRTAPTYRNPVYLSYLAGSRRTHSLMHDFEKLARARLPAGDRRAVCLIGFDHEQAPMDAEVDSICRNACEAGFSWTLATRTNWPDRRNSAFRYGVWIWTLDEMPAEAS